ncbi:MAG: alpha/beta family hydrolase [Pseudomonadota bacterium]|nr:alpha/beta family hydrolase [Pseudomonadota bacterium]
MDFLISGDETARATLLLGHGSGAPMDTDWMNTLSTKLVDRGVRVVRFEFDYMAARRTGGSKRPPPDVALLCDEYRAAITALETAGPLFIAGKSMGGRVASMIAEAVRDQVSGVVCLGYPFHPQGKPEKLRTAHLADLKVPTLIAQGTRDPFGTSEDVAGYTLSDAISIHWLDDGDHDLKPRKTVTGKTLDDHLNETSNAISDWIGKQIG